jgi:hypothetical protein
LLLKLPFFLISVVESYIIYSYLPLSSSFLFILQSIFFRLIRIVTDIRTQDRLLTLTIRYLCNVITMQFLFLKQLLKGNSLKEQYCFPNIFFSAACFVARKMNSSSLMFLSELFKSMSLGCTCRLSGRHSLCHNSSRIGGISWITFRS